MKIRITKIFFMITIFILCIFQKTGCAQIYNINIDGVNISCVNFSIPSDNNHLEEIITPIIKTVKNNLGDNLTISEVRMPNPLLINFKLDMQSENKNDFELIIGEFENISIKINKAIQNNIEDYSILDNWNIELFDNNKSILKIDSGVNTESNGVFNSLYLNDTLSLKYINSFENNYSRLYNNTKKELPENLNKSFSNIQDLRTYINSNRGFDCLLNFSDLKYICIIIENDSSNSLNLSNLKDCKSAEYIDLYLFKNISISEFPELNNLKGLCIHNADIEEADISNLQNRLSNCNVSLISNMEIY